MNLAADPEFFNDIHADVEQEHDATGESNWKVTGKPGRHIGVTGCLRVSQGVSGCRGSCSRSYRSDLFWAVRNT